LRILWRQSQYLLTRNQSSINLFAVKENDLPVLFYDGNCGLCRRSVRFLLRQDRRGRLYFAPLQGATAAARLSRELRESLSSAVYQRQNGENLLRSDAVLQVLIDIGSRWRWLARLALKIPRRWRDRCYDWVGARRLQLDRARSCPMPSGRARRRILP